ncbi:hypothetical protein F2Q68_00002902 [Brassica cretica]|uniref:Uncharacterized protein n=1 Tax=Brassica cretica TaxID=69181 RepID=A0A8S9JKA5_BRACR|nr:hypothetical protein F2Q68_00002902 [Brassica cretica]
MCRNVYTSETGSSRVSGDRVSGAAKTLFVNGMEGLLRTVPLCVEEDGSKESRETFCLVEDKEVGLEKECGSMNEVTEETAIELNFQTKNRFFFFFFFFFL